VKPDEVDWVFDALPPSGARRGGDPAKHAFEASLPVFVREVVQNAIDQAMPGEPPDIHFRFRELAGAELAAFFDAARWETLRRHLGAAAASRGGAGLAKALKELEQRQKLLVLLVEDRDTVGLTGHEDDGDSHFRALCKDTLYSHKQSEGAGGSYGLGKSVLWGFSGLSTVLFLSKLSDEKPGQTSPRLIGRTELPTHTVRAPDEPSHAGSKAEAKAITKLTGKASGKLAAREETFAGSGWFGARTAEPPYRAESLWADDAEELAAPLGLARVNADTTGTSILILAFRDPTADAEPSPAELAAGIRGALEKEFWPAVAMRRLSAWVASGQSGGIVAERELKLARPFIEAYRSTSEAKALASPGEVVCRDLPVEVPARRDGSAPAVTGRVRLAVRLCGEHEHSELMGKVALFRSPGMVVRYLDQRALVRSSRPFHAMVACGGARAPGDPEPADAAVERFLRAAEPPGHDKWDVTETLKADYKSGYKKALDQLNARIVEALKSIMLDTPAQGRRGPERLRKKFPLGAKGGGGGSESAFRFGNIAAHYEAGRWRFRGEIWPARPLPAWSCELSLSELGEDGGKLGELAVAELTTREASVIELRGGVGHVRTQAVLLAFEGQSASGNACRALGLEIKGRFEREHGGG
jgi:hypothetical protein